MRLMSEGKIWSDHMRKYDDGVRDDWLFRDIDEYQKEVFISDIVNQYSEMIVRLAFTYLKDWGKSEDVMQEVFVTCYKKLDTFRGDSNIKSWLYKITINKCKDQMRKWDFRSFNIIKRLSGIQVYHSDSPELTLVIQEEFSQLAEVIMSLPIKYREVIILYYYEELSLHEISELLGTNPATVNTRLFRARGILNQKISSDRKRKEL
jgi:RNA polymerase sigma-70 factor, ECF subfamily